MYPHSAQSQSVGAIAGSMVGYQQANAPESQPTPMTRDLNVLGESIARLAANIDMLRKQLDPVIRPMPVPAAETKSPQLVKAERSSVGSALEEHAAQVESLIERVQYLQSAVEV